MSTTTEIERYDTAGFLVQADPSSYPPDEGVAGQQPGEWERRMLGVHGYRPLDPRYLCPRWVVGKQHLTREPCVCRPSDLWDHARAWKTGEGERIITTEPYAVRRSSLAVYRRTLAPLGLRIRVAAGSQWYRGSTHLLVIERRTR